MQGCRGLGVYRGLGVRVFRVFRVFRVYRGLGVRVFRV